MAAYIYLVCLVKLILNRSLFYTGFCREYILQCLCPVLQRLIHGNRYRTVLKCIPVSHLTDYSISNSQLSYHAVRNLTYNIAPARCKEISRIHIVLNLNTHAVSKCHLAHSLGQSVSFHSICRNNPSCLNILMKLCITIQNLTVNRQIVRILFNAEDYQLVSCLFQLRSNNMSAACHIHCKGNQCRRNINLAMLFIIKGAGHTVLTANRRKPKAQLRIVCT